MRVLYVQYTNPGAYPPLARGAQILADAGCAVRMLGVEVPGTGKLGVPPHPGIEARSIPPAGKGWRLKAHYARYCSWVVREAVRWCPDWIYASDLFSAPVALAAMAVTGSRVVYHEHDAPSPTHDSWFVRRCLAARRQLATRADLRIAPNAERAAVLARVSGGRGVHAVWNCPLRRSVRPHRSRSDDTFRLTFRGSINDQRLPRAVFEALSRLPRHVTLDVAGYETVGSRGYIGELMALAERIGIGDRVRMLGNVADDEIGEVCEHAHVGLALMPVDSGDVNMRHMTGASNKVFEYLATGVVPLVSDLPDWRATFVEPGYAIGCDPTNATSIAHAIVWADVRRHELRQIVERGRRRLLEDWNYEAQFAPVVEAMTGMARRPSPPREAMCAS